MSLSISSCGSLHSNALCSATSGSKLTIVALIARVGSQPKLNNSSGDALPHFC